MAADAEEFAPDDRRFVRARCPICDRTSPTVDQRTDIHRTAMGEWWKLHRAVHMPAPIIEVAPSPRIEPCM